MSEIPEVFAIFEQKLAHVLSFNLRQKGQKKAIEELLVYFSGIVARASKAEARIAELEMKIRHNALWQASEDAEERAHLEKLVPDLKKRIAELEKAYRWISTTENPPPEDKRFVLAVNATNGKTYYFVLPDLNDSSDNAG
jgi:hypothetical protein